MTLETLYILCVHYVSINVLEPSPMTSPASAATTDARASGTRYPGTPLWVKVSGIVALLILVVVVLVMVVVGGDHGPMRHLPSASALLFLV
jgi:hypothetical protein